MESLKPKDFLPTIITAFVYVGVIIFMYLWKDIAESTRATIIGISSAILITLNSTIDLVIKQYFNKSLEDYKKIITKDVEDHKKGITKEVEDYKKDIAKDIAKEVEDYKKGITKEIEDYKKDIAKDIAKEVEDYKKKITKEIKVFDLQMPLLRDTYSEIIDVFDTVRLASSVFVGDEKAKEVYENAEKNFQSLNLRFRKNSFTIPTKLYDSYKEIINQLDDILSTLYTYRVSAKVYDKIHFQKVSEASKKIEKDCKILIEQIEKELRTTLGIE